MKYPICCVRDDKTGFGSLSVEMNEGVSIRGFSYAINNTDLMNFAPKDFSLYRVGVFDSDSGCIVPEKVPVLLVSGSSVYGVKVNG